MRINIKTNRCVKTYDFNEISLFTSNQPFNKNNWCLETNQLKWNMSEMRYPDFSIFDNHITSADECIVSTEDEFAPFITFALSFNGAIGYKFEKVKEQRREKIWTGGTANIIVQPGMEGYARYSKKTSNRMFEIVISANYFANIAKMYPDLFRSVYKRFMSGESFFVAPENINVTSRQIEICEDILSAKVMGNLSQMYVDAKILEHFSLFMFTYLNNKKQVDNPISVSEKEKIYHARDIIEKNYLNPPTLYQLALMVGTNECKLKSAFKKVLGTTVFGYLFDFRMDIALQYLLNTSKTIQEISNLIGYEHQAHFSTAFKKKFQKTPTEYRMNNAKFLQ